MNHIHVFETADAVEHISLHGMRAVVIDILRATTTITTALQNGAVSVVPVTTVEAVLEFLPENGFDLLRAGERQGLKVTGFDLGNSPLEYQQPVVAGKQIVMSTSNGTRALVNSLAADSVWIASFRNAAAIVNALTASRTDIAIVQAGSLEAFSLEDGLCAGLLIDRICAIQPDWELDAAGRHARACYKKYADDLYQGFLQSIHGQNLIRLGFENDLRFCAEIDQNHIVPKFNQGKITV